MLENYDPSVVNHKTVWNIVCGLIGYPAVFVAHELKLFSVLEQSAKTTDEICEVLKTDRRGTEAMLSVCASLGLLTFSENKYALSATAREYLLDSSPLFTGGMLDLCIGNSTSISIDSLRTAIKTGRTQAYNGQDIFESHSQMLEQAKIFTRGMHGISAAPAQYWPKCVDLKNNNVLLDIGGGSGAHTIGALKLWPHLKGVIFDMAHVCIVATEMAEKNELSNQMSTHIADLWNDNFPVADVHFYSQIFHDWPEDKCRFLAQKSFDALPSNGRIIIHEILYNDDKTGPFVAAASSIGMLLWTQGRQYSGTEIATMLQNSGFVSIEVIPTIGYWGIVTALKP